MKRIYFLTATMLLVFFSAIETKAQGEKKAQFTFFYPIGSSGHKSTDYVYKFSFNTIYGITGGVNGFELASVGNISRDNARGLQLAGVFNQVSTMDTTNRQGVGGFQLAGVSNVVKGNQNGCQIAGACNITLGNSLGAIISGAVNSSGGDVNGAMVSGAINMARSIKGLQLSTANIAHGHLNGAQIGALNIAGKGKGFQLGVVNIVKNPTDSILPLGVFNIVKGGYYALELSTDEMLFANISYKMGVEKLYTIFRFGAGFHDNTNFYCSGGGLGTMFNIGQKNKIAMEAVSIQFYENDFKYIPDMLEQLSLNYQYNISNRLALKFGPTVNCFVEKNGKTNNNDALRIPYSIIKGNGKEHTTSIWVGANAGLTMKL